MSPVPANLPLNDPAFYASDPWDVFRQLRDECPVYWCEAGGFWALTRHEDVLAVSTNPDSFCNGQGMTMRGGELSHVQGGETMITMDPPQHTTQRALVKHAFTARAVKRLEVHIGDIARAVFNDVPTGQPIDFVDAVAARVPAIVIAELLGVPIEDRDKFVKWTNASVGVADPEYADEQGSAVFEQYEYFEHIIAERRQHPEDDLLSVLVEAETTREDFTHDDLLTLCFLLLAAGNETTRNLISNSVETLAGHPDQLARLRDGRHVRLAVEEMMRWVSPAIHMARTVTVDTELRGQQLCAGDQVVMLYGAANRDDRVFGPTADELDVNRDPNPHLGFGFGTHFCLGAALARLEAAAVFTEMLDRFQHWRVVGPVQRLRSTMIRGIKHMPVILDA